MRIRTAIATALIAALVLPSAALAAYPQLSTEARIRSVAEARFRTTEASVAKGAFPYYVRDGRWATTGVLGWTAGFYPGSLSAGYQLTGNRTWLDASRVRQAPLAQVADWTGSHDLGFMFVPTYVSNYHITGNRAYRAVALEAADSLARQYEPAIGCIPARTTADTADVIVDSLMNTELLVFSARNGGPASHLRTAIRHARTVRRLNVREDGSVYQFTRFDRKTGDVLARGNTQGAGPQTVWSRGQAWAIHGFANLYETTHRREFLTAARLCASWWVGATVSNPIPPWDFSVPDAEHAPRDTSAASVAAAGLFVLASAETSPALAAKWRAAGERTVQALGDGYLTAPGESPALLREGALSVPAGAYNHGLSFGDYYLLEALTRYRRLQPGTPAKPPASARVSGAGGSTRVTGALARVTLRPGQYVDLKFARAETFSRVGVAFSDKRRASQAMALEVIDRRGVVVSRTRVASAGMTTAREHYALSKAGRGTVVRVRLLSGADTSAVSAAVSAY